MHDVLVTRCQSAASTDRPCQQSCAGGRECSCRAHPNKSGDNYSGSTAWLNAVRSQVTLDLQHDADGAIIDPDARVLSTGEANYARLGEAIKFRGHKWAFVREDDLPADTRAELSQVIKANEENAAFLKCLAISTERKKPYQRTLVPTILGLCSARCEMAKNTPVRHLNGPLNGW